MAKNFKVGDRVHFSRSGWLLYMSLRGLKPQEHILWHLAEGDYTVSKVRGDEFDYLEFEGVPNLVTQQTFFQHSKAGST